MELPTDKDFAYEMTPLKFVSWPMGTWPLQEYNFVTGMRSVVAIILLLLMFLILNTETYLDFGNAEKNIDAVVMIACSMLAISKVASFRFRPAGLIANFVSAVNDYQELNGEEKRAIVKRHAHMARVVFLNILFYSYICAILLMLVPLLAGEDDTDGNLNQTRKFQMSYPMPSDRIMERLQVSGYMYVIIFIGEYFLLILLTVGNLGSDTLFFGIVFHLCGQVEVLKLDFCRFLDDKQNGAKRFNALVKRHHHLLTLLDHLNDTIQNILFLQLFSSSLLICITGFQFIISLEVHNIVMLMKTAVVVNTLLVQMFVYSYVGEYSKNQFGGIGHLVYCSEWYNAPCNLSKSIPFVLMKAQSSVHLKAGRFFVVNLETYMSILKTSMSYLSVLRAMVIE